MMIFGAAEVVTSFTHQFFGLTTTQAVLSTVIGATIGSLYFGSGILVVTRRAWAATTAIVFLLIDAVGRMFMVATGLYPLDSGLQTFAIIVGTAIVVLFAIYLWRNKSSFR